VACALAGGLAADASARTATVRDARGDARAPWDITRVVVTNGQGSLRLRVVYRGTVRVKAGTTGFLVNIALDMGRASPSVYTPDFSLDLLRGSPSGDRTQLVRQRGRALGCRGLKASVGGRAVTFVVPQRCFGARAGRVRIAGFSYQPRSTADRADYIGRWSRWIARG
jgi:hypothetical protein